MDVPEPVFVEWHGRVARVRAAQGDGHLVVEVVSCYGHGEEAVDEIEVQTYITSPAGGIEYFSDIRLDWENALSELQSGSFYEGGELRVSSVEWLAEPEAADVRAEVFGFPE